MNELVASRTEKLLQYVDLLSSLMDTQSPESGWLPVDLWFPRRQCDWYPGDLSSSSDVAAGGRQRRTEPLPPARCSHSDHHSLDLKNNHTSTFSQH